MTKVDQIVSIYFFEAVGLGLIKIGSSQEPRTRLKNLATWSPVELKFLGAVSAPRASEAVLHERFKAHRERFEWYRATDVVRNFVDDVLLSGVMPPDVLADAQERVVLSHARWARWISGKSEEPLRHFRKGQGATVS